MLQNILKLEGIEVLDKTSQQDVKGGGLFNRDYFACQCGNNTNTFQVRACNLTRAERKADRKCPTGQSSSCVQTNI
ncbi:hypothetical protein [uncultured Tenacibaculum sp.]|uniref:hypothetical protein n=1 Tax=uncultured Tenacibaculum sp. TaxID=174713 RepID=UPI00262B5731|nr:hypothetical protein [uncultured Tenacibaculum sp.]